jgi:hypothetical protein
MEQVDHSGQNLHATQMVPNSKDGLANAMSLPHVYSEDLVN